MSLFKNVLVRIEIELEAILAFAAKDPYILFPIALKTY